MRLTKTIELSDYDLLKYEVAWLKSTHKYLTENDVKIDIGHENRFWEYGMALKSIGEWKNNIKNKEIEILDVGAGDSLLAPSLSMLYHQTVNELEPRFECYHNRVICNKALVKSICPEIKWIHGLLGDGKLEGEIFDVVYSISVIEHVHNDRKFITDLAEKVKLDGLLFLTTDVVPRMPASYTFDNLRARNYTIFSIEQILEYLKAIGFEPFGEVDLEYHGAHVFDYTFMSICMKRIK